MSAKRKEHVITAGIHKGKRCTIVSRKRTKSNDDTIEVNIIEGPIIMIPKIFVK